jgi:hypothetical protein
MSKVALDNAPTMIIPSGTEIQVDGYGQLSIRAPGNLVIQNSGSYGTIESVRGSIRIEADVQVEAVNVRCAKVCYVQGSLTAWKVQAEAIQLEESARAHIILQETEALQIGQKARLVGNFSSEKELFLLFSRFARQMRALPFFDRGEAPEPELAPVRERVLDTGGRSSPPPATETSAPESERGVAGELPDGLFYALVVLEREAQKPGAGPNYRRIVSELLRMLKARELARLRDTYAQLYAEVVHPSDDLRRAVELIRDHYVAA